MLANGIPGGGVSFLKSSNSFVRRYWPFLIGMFATVLIVVRVPGQPAALCRGSDCLTILAQKVTADGDNNWTGSFVVTKSPFGIHSDRLSGACLFVESAALNLPDKATSPGGKCSSDDQCGGGVLRDDPGPADDAFVGWEGRCDKGTGTCWIRPGKGDATKSPVCNKKLTPKLTIPTPSNIPAFNPASLTAHLKSSGPIRARVLACLNGSFTTPPGTKPNPPCGDLGNTNRIETFGAPVLLNTKPGGLIPTPTPTPNIHR